MIDFPLDVAVNSVVMAAVVGTLLLLPPQWLIAPQGRQRWLIALLMGTATTVAMFWSPLAGQSNEAVLRPAYQALGIFLLGRQIGVAATLIPAAVAILLQLPHTLGHLAVMGVVLVWSEGCRTLYHRRNTRLQLWLSLLMLSAGVQAVVTVCYHLNWLGPLPESHLWRFMGSTLLLGLCLELLLGRARYEVQLKRRENELLQVLDASGGGRWVWEPLSRITTFQGHFYNQFELQVQPGEDPWSSWQRMWHPEDAARLSGVRISLLKRPEDNFEAEFRVRNRQGQWRWILVRGRIVDRNAQGETVRVVGMHLDVTSGHEAHEALLLSQTKFQTIYEAFPDAAGITRVSDGTYIEVNPAFCRLLGHERDELIGRSSIELNIWNSPEERSKLLLAFHEKGQVDSLPLIARAADGRVVPGRMSARQINMDGEPCFIFLFHDMSEQQAMQDQLVRVNALLLQAGRIARLGVWEDSPRPEERYWSEVCYELHGLSPDAGPPSDYAGQCVAPEYQARFRELLRRCVQEQRAFQEELEVVRGDGRRIWVQAMAEPVLSNGQVDRVRGVIRDIDEAKRSLDRLRQSEDRFARIFRAIPDPMGISRKSDGHYLDVNPAWEQTMGVPRQEALCGQSVVEMGLYTLAERTALVEAANATGMLNAFEINFTSRDGQVHTALQSMQTIEVDGVECWLFGLKDITERKRAERLVQEREALLSLTIEAAALALWDLNMITVEVTGDRHWRELRGLPALAGENPSEHWNDVVHPDDRQTAMAALARHQANPSQPFDVTLRLRHADGGSRWVRNLGRVIAHSSRGTPLRMVGVALDVTRQREQEDQLQKMAHFDALTGLPNRVQLAQALDHAMLQARQHGNLLGVAYLDLDGFKPVNDRLGHGIGDQLLIEIGRRLQAAIRPQDLVARLGGDEFVILLSNPGCLSDCETMLKRLMNRMAEPVLLEGERLGVTASIGLTLFPNDDADADALLRHADQAMYLAKQAGRNRIHLFDAERERASREQHSRLDRLSSALAAGEFCLYVQPKVDMLEGTLVGAEALARWQHPERGLLGPGEFLPQIEGSSLEVAFGEWVLGHSLQLQQAWLAQGLRVPLSLNISARHLQTPDFPERVRQRLASCPDVPTSLLEIEITESAALTDIHAVTSTLTQLRNMGLSIAIDDFGTGYSSLTYLRQLPADALKIDRSFVNGMMTDIGDMAIVDGVIGLSRSFGLTLIAEGVETSAQGQRLLEMGCRLGQGYGIARPMPPSELQAWARQWQAPAEWRLPQA
ncbi:EAL domain-containing protein [Curvibacter sp. HBC28]|uniref:EAL domain-containing protein n=1 Tax=Curvibacter microcysteis TaxID=3026419 RepID=A0ABT5MGG6_9BURK|nr:EAL domain-containing protein [Curvibacter sp. HBC28]MDD0815012.1 EAL domain-containing protein [Curvibacter sp. HBC28]